MKTIWTVDYIRKSNRHPWQWCRNKLEELETKTGINWITYHSHGKQVFLPRWSKDSSAIADERAAKALLALIPQSGGVYAATFLKLHEQTGMPLAHIMSVCKHLVKTHQLVPVQGRVDGVIAVYKTRAG